MGPHPRDSFNLDTTQGPPPCAFTWGLGLPRRNLGELPPQAHSGRPLSGEDQPAQPEQEPTCSSCWGASMDSFPPPPGGAGRSGFPPQAGPTHLTSLRRCAPSKWAPLIPCFPLPETFLAHFLLVNSYLKPHPSLFFCETFHPESRLVPHLEPHLPAHSLHVPRVASFSVRHGVLRGKNLLYLYRCS